MAIYHYGISFEIMFNFLINLSEDHNAESD